MPTHTTAIRNIESHLQHNPYPGRGLVVGRSSTEDVWLIVYWIMGRSASSRNRRFVAADTTLRTEPIDTRHMQHPELLIYEAMLELPSLYLVSNGDQTRTIYDTLQAGGTFDSALATREREPDAPHYTPRISAMLTLQPYPSSLTLSILKANAADPALTDRITYYPATPPQGLGYGLTTYHSDGNPLPSFSGDPLLLPLNGNAQDVLDTYWNALNADNRVSIAVKRIAQDGSSCMLVRNRFEERLLSRSRSSLDRDRALARRKPCHF
jgi:IMP cyclohydrolase